MTAMVLLSEWQRSQVEFWRKTQFDGYDVSNFGRVRSWWRKGGPRRRSDVPHIVGGSKDSYGYRFVEFGHLSTGRRRRAWIHRLVTTAFIENPDALPEINHKTAVKDDNRLDNLEWISSRGNMRHAVAHGLREYAKQAGENHRRATITEVDVRAIRRRRAEGERPRDIARDYSKATVAHILAGRSWKHVE